MTSSYSTADEDATGSSVTTSPAASLPPPKELARAEADGAVEDEHGRAAQSPAAVLSKLMYESLAADVGVQTVWADRLLGGI